MKHERRTELAERERRIREAIRSVGAVRAEAAFRERLKREFVEGTISESALSRDEPRPRALPRWGWILVPAAALVLLVVLLLPQPSPNWTVQALHGEGNVEVDGRTLAPDEAHLVARALGAGGRVRVSAGLALDLRLDERLLLELDEEADVTLPVLSERDDRAPMVSEVHHGELRIKTGPGFPGNEMHILTAEGRTEIVGTTISVYKGEGYTCVCVLEGTARVGMDEDRLEDVPSGMLKIMFDDGNPPMVMEISSEHEAGLLDFSKRYTDDLSARD